MAGVAGGVGGTRPRDARAGAVRLRRRRRRLRVDDPCEPGGVRTPPAAAADARGNRGARPVGRGARVAVAGAVPARARRRPLDRPRGEGARRRPRLEGDRRPDDPLERRVDRARGRRGRARRRAAMVPALLVVGPRARRQPRRPRRRSRLRRDRRHARHADARLARARPRERLPPLPRRRRAGAVLQRPALPRAARRGAGGGRPDRVADGAGRVPEPRAHLVRPGLAARPHRPADPREGGAPGRRCATRARARCRRDRRLESRRPPGRRRRSPRSTRSSRCGTRSARTQPC